MHLLVLVLQISIYMIYVYRSKHHILSRNIHDYSFS